MALAERTAEVVWTATLARGEGRLKAGSGAVGDLPIDVRAAVPELSEEDFQRAARDADAQCPISKALRGDVDVRLTASLA